MYRDPSSMLRATLTNGETVYRAVGMILAVFGLLFFTGSLGSAEPVNPASIVTEN